MEGKEEKKPSHLVLLPPLGGILPTLKPLILEVGHCATISSGKSKGIRSPSWLPKAL